MLNSYDYYSTSNVHVDVKQQPNDAADSARLYGELRDKANKEIASATVEHMGANNEVVVLQCAHAKDYMLGRHKTRLIFKVNGELYDITTDVDPYKIRESVFGALLHEVFNQALEKMTSYDKNQLLQSKP